MRVTNVSHLFVTRTHHRTHHFVYSPVSFIAEIFTSFVVSGSINIFFLCITVYLAPSFAIHCFVLRDLQPALIMWIFQGEEKGNINAQDACGRTALYTAVSNGSLQCLEILLDNGGEWR